MTIEDKINSGVLNRVISGLTVPDFVLLNPNDLATLKREIYSKYALSPCLTPPVTNNFECIECQTDCGTLKVVGKKDGKMEFKCSLKLNGLQLLLRVKEKMENA